MYSYAVLTTSDAGARGERTDTGGEAIKGALLEPVFRLLEHAVVADDRSFIEGKLRQWVSEGTDFIVTTGGTGFTARDVTPEATRAVCDREAPGIAEAIRAYGVTKTPMAMLSRGVAAIAGNTLIVNLPGSLRGVQESLEVLLPVLPHVLGQLTGRDRGH